MSLPPPFKLWELQEALHAKAKGKSELSVLRARTTSSVGRMCWRRRADDAIANGGAPGVDGVRLRRTSKPMGVMHDGSENWRKSYGTRVIVPERFAGCTFRSRDRETKTVGNSRHPGSRGSDGGGAGLGTNL